jgi:sialidase-1
MSPWSGKIGSGAIDWHHPGVYQHIGYPSVVQNADGTIACLYHEWSDDERPLQYVRCTRFRLAD